MKGVPDRISLEQCVSWEIIPVQGGLPSCSLSLFSTTHIHGLFVSIFLQGVQTQLAAKSKGAQAAAGALTAVSRVRMRAARVFGKLVIRDSEPSKSERVSVSRRQGGAVHLHLDSSRRTLTGSRLTATIDAGKAGYWALQGGLCCWGVTAEGSPHVLQDVFPGTHWRRGKSLRMNAKVVGINSRVGAMKYDVSPQMLIQAVSSLYGWLHPHFLSGKHLSPNE